MTIAILDYSNLEVIMVSLDYRIIEEKYGDSVERYITEHMGYDLSGIRYMASDSTMYVIPASHTSFDNDGEEG